MERVQSGCYGGMMRYADEIDELFLSTMATF
jgi:hypothetical protein